MNRKDIKKIIPHREPFLLVDEVLEMEVGKKIVAKKYVDKSEYYFEGHFPSEKIMPGVLIIESLAQAGAIAILSMEENKGKIAYFGSVDKAKFRQKVVPGDEIILEVELINIRSRAGTGVAKAYKAGKVCCQCEIMFMLG